MSKGEQGEKTKKGNHTQMESEAQFSKEQKQQENVTRMNARGKEKETRKKESPGNTKQRTYFENVKLAERVRTWAKTEMEDAMHNVGPHCVF